VDLTSEDVQDILQLLDGLPYRELTVETASFRLSVRRDADGAWTQTMQVLAEPNVLPSAAAPSAAAPSAAPVTGAPVSTEPVSLASTAAAAGEPAATDGLVEVRAPLLGTFYRAPRPGAPPFVTVGSEVAPDTVVCIIETMKLMNSVTAGVGGTIAEILLDNAQFAAQGVVLMRVREQR
jgi:acetyl-CoA carboxylase biotin carboxyl carrier protein